MKEEIPANGANTSTSNITEDSEVVVEEVDKGEHGKEQKDMQSVTQHVEERAVIDLRMMDQVASFPSLPLRFTNSPCL